jgi:hypothetical protein
LLRTHNYHSSWPFGGIVGKAIASAQVFPLLQEVFVFLLTGIAEVLNFSIALKAIVLNINLIMGDEVAP